MEIRPIRSEADHDEALREIERLMEFPQNSPENDKLDVLATLVADYEDRCWPTDAELTPVEVLRYAIEDMGRSQKELGDIIGSRSLASEILSGKRTLSLDAAKKIGVAWRIPIALLVGFKMESVRQSA